MRRYNAAVSTDAIDTIVAQWTRERPELDVSSTHILQRITRLYLLQSSSFAQVFEPFGLTFGEYEVLAALMRSGPPYRMKPVDLIASLVLSSGAMTNRIDRVEQLGLVERLPDPRDRRGVLVSLTGQGRSVTSRAVEAHLANEERLLTALGPAERRQLTDLLRRLLTSEPFSRLDPGRPEVEERRPRRRRSTARR